MWLQAHQECPNCGTRLVTQAKPELHLQHRVLQLSRKNKGNSNGSFFLKIFPVFKRKESQTVDGGGDLGFIQKSISLGKRKAN